MRSDILVLVLLVFGAGACHRDEPGFTTPTTVTGVPTLVIRSARPPHGPVPGAAVDIEGFGTFVADSGGLVLLPDIDARQVFSVSADGFVVPHITMLHQAIEGTVYLLPNDHDMPWHWLYEAFYKSNEQGSLWRPEPGVVDVSASEEIFATPYVLSALEWGIGTINRAQPHMSYVLSQGAGPIRIYRDPNDPIFTKEGYTGAWAVAFAHLNRGVVIGGRIVFKFFTRDEVTERHLHQTMAHELAHLTALNGHAPGGLMTNWDMHQDFSPQEKLAMFMAFLRPAGTRPPDDAAGSLVHSSGPVGPGLRTGGGLEERIVCVVQQ